MDSISDSDSEDAGSIPAGTTKAGKLKLFWFTRFFICVKSVGNFRILSFN